MVIAHFFRVSLIVLNVLKLLWTSDDAGCLFSTPIADKNDVREYFCFPLGLSVIKSSSPFLIFSSSPFQVWNSDHPVTKKHSYNMKQFNWKYTQFSQFNQSDTLLLVSGVHFGTIHSSSGEIAVFNLEHDEFTLQCRVSNRPYDIFGAWLTDQFLISGDIHWLAHLVSTSVMWLNRANQETRSEHVQILKQLFKFYNRNGSSIRAVMVANCPWLSDQEDVEMVTRSEQEEANNLSPQRTQSPEDCSGNPISRLQSNFRANMGRTGNDVLGGPLDKDRDLTVDDSFPIKYSEKFRKDFEKATTAEEQEHDQEQQPKDHEPTASSSTSSSSSSSTSTSDDENVSVYDELELFTPKYLIFSLGSKTYTPHQIGFKKIRDADVSFPKRMEMGLTLQERIARRKMEALEEPRFQQDWLDYDSVQDQFNKVDKLIDLHGHVIGMGLSPDQRYLYVNSRPWPENYVITNPMEPPPIAQEIDIHVIDMMTLEPVGQMLRAHKAYTPNTECFFIFLDVCDDYVGR